MTKQPYSEKTIGNLTRRQLEEIITEITQKAIAQELKNTQKSKDKELAATFGTWEDERTEVEIVTEIYDIRNSNLTSS